MYIKVEHRKLKKCQAILAYSLYPLVTLLAMIAAWSLLERGHSPIYSMGVPVVIANLIIWIGEFILPYELKWRPSLKVLSIDILHTLVSAKVLTPIVKILIIGAISKYSLVTTGIWPTQWPLALQVMLAILIADFLIYSAHRWMHATKIGWRIHILHHTPTKLHFWASARSHPLNVVLVYTIEVGVLLLLGISVEALVVWTVFMSINGLFEHCNVDIRPGFLNYIFATSDVHRVHHSPNWDYSNSNFGNTTVIWDQIFGTFCLPAKPIKDVGIQMHKVPENYIDHMILPFNMKKYKV